MNPKNLKAKTIWNGEYRGIIFAIHNWNFDVSSPGLPEECWNYYLFLELSKFEDKELAESLWLEDKEDQYTPKSPIRVTHDYYGNPFLANLNMHGGITYYEKKHFHKERVIKVGCDFQHLHDDQECWKIEGVLNDCEKCIDKMLSTTSYGHKE